MRPNPQGRHNLSTGMHQKTWMPQEVNPSALGVWKVPLNLSGMDASRELESLQDPQL